MPACTACLIDAASSMIFGVGCSCFYTMGFREEFRRQNGLPATCGGDFFSHCCCFSCAWCQEAREIDHLIKQANHPAGSFGMCGEDGLHSA